MAEEQKFVPGVFVKAPSANAPGYVKCTIGIKVDELGVWLREQYKAGNEWVNIDVKQSQGGKWYAALSTYKPANRR